MDAFLHQLRISLSLHFRNRMALIYSYLFPTIFLIAFWVLYRYDRVPLARHMGELLTVTALGGACFGLPTTMVSERERGVWRRYRLAPVRTGALLASAIAARYVLLVLAGLLQVALAMLIGMPLPTHPLDLWVAFTFVAFALMGLGLVIATLADNVPAVQALGQCIFLPMLIIGGVAVQLTSLPEWAQHVSAFFPGRYAVEAMQASVTGGGLGVMRFSLLALLLIGFAGFLAGIRLFRWDAEQRFMRRGGKAWLVVALGAWAAVGLLAESRGRIGPVPIVAENRTPELDGRAARPDAPPPSTAPGGAPTPSPTPSPAAGGPPAPAPSSEPAPSPSPPPASSSSATAAAADPGHRAVEPTPPQTAPKAVAAGKGAAPSAPPPPAKPAAEKPRADKPSTTGPPEPLLPEPATWQQVTPAHIDEVVFGRLPSDSGVVAPIAPIDEPLEPELETELEEVRSRLVTWGPARVADPVQRVRNILYVAAVPDVFQIPEERYLPHIVFERLQGDIPKDDLIKILFWVATHPQGGDDSAADDLRSAGVPVNGPGDVEQARERVMLYALKLLGRLVGKIPK
jgi:ABC-type transport system involved in cytochrome c biogenesis permease component